MAKWRVYKRSNRVTGKSYVGVTSQTIEDRWCLHAKSAEKIVKKIAAASKHKVESRRRSAMAHVNSAKFTSSIDYDVWQYGLHSDVWAHEVLFETDNVVEALLRERAEIAKLDPTTSYNRTSGGEVPKYMRIDQILDAARELGVLDEVTKKPADR